MVGLQAVDKSSTPLSGNAAEFFDNAPTYFSTITASVVGLQAVDKSSTPVSGNAAEFFDNAPTSFSTIMASVVGLQVVDKSSTPVSGNAAEFFDNAPTYFSTIATEKRQTLPKLWVFGCRFNNSSIDKLQNRRDADLYPGNMLKIVPLF